MSRRLLVTVFAREEDILGATAAARARGLIIADVYAPYPIRGLDHVMGLRRSRLPWICFLFGVLGGVSTLLFQYWVSAVNWPINVGGKPWNSLPAFVPAAFEVTVLFAGVGTVAAFLLTTGLRPWKRAVLPDPRVTDDQFALVLVEGSPALDRADVNATLAPFRPVRPAEYLEGREG